MNKYDENSKHVTEKNCFNDDDDSHSPFRDFLQNDSYFPNVLHIFLFFLSAALGKLTGDRLES